MKRPLIKENIQMASIPEKKDAVCINNPQNWIKTTVTVYSIPPGRPESESANKAVEQLSLSPAGGETDSLVRKLFGINYWSWA